jgi:two-component system, chemotaxis family, chemotaxis protein CheY
MTSPTYDILVVDDSAVMRAMLIRVLRISGLPIGTVHEAGDGVRALDVLSAHKVDLALVDINMPIMNGDELLDRIRETPALVDLPVLIVSTEHSDTRIGSVMRRGAGFVHKPFTAEQIRAAALRAIGVPHA